MTLTDKEKLSRVKVIFVLGGPGSGKGTQCERILKDHPNFGHLSAGDLLRMEASTPGSQYGQIITDMMKNGEIVPMHITIGLLRNAILRDCDSKSVFLIDGFPRKLDQAHAFEDDVKPCEFVLNFVLSEEIMLQRLLKRGQTSGRVDDTIESIMKRFKVQSTTVEPVVHYFAGKGKVHNIDAAGSVEEVYTKVATVISKSVM